MAPRLFLIPSLLGDTPVEAVLPMESLASLHSLNYFIVEDLRTARRFLSKAGFKGRIEELHFVEWNEHSKAEDAAAVLQSLADGFDTGLISDAGLPAVADPGADLVAIAHNRGYTVCPLTGPSSLMLALMASGMNGQSFAFNGYLPVREPDRSRQILKLEARSAQENQTQIFIETPYRNKALIEAFLGACHPGTRLCVAANLTCSDAFIKSANMEIWKKNLKNWLPEFEKKPCVFIIHS